MRIFMRVGVVLLLAGFWLLTPARAQSDLKTPNCAAPQAQGERVCCQTEIAQICQQFGYSAPGADQDTQDSSIPPLTEIDTLKPFGAAVGTPFSVLEAKMNEMGMRQDDCSWTSHNSKKVSVTVNVSLISPHDGSEIQNCARNLPIHSIYVTFLEEREEVFAKLPMPAAMAAGWIERFGEPYHDCRKPYLTAGSSNTARCMFDNADPTIQRLMLAYRHNPIERSVLMKISQFGKDQSAAVVESSQGSGSETAQAVLNRNMANPIQAAVTCGYIKAAVQSGKNFELDGVKIVEKGKMLADMPEACE
ncbi:MAG: hypothetical protein AAF495_14160 [Pseudomonadota bacterium]